MKMGRMLSATDRLVIAYNLFIFLLSADNVCSHSTSYSKITGGLTSVTVYDDYRPNLGDYIQLFEVGTKLSLKLS